MVWSEKRGDGDGVVGGARRWRDVSPSFFAFSSLLFFFPSRFPLPPFFLFFSLSVSRVSSILFYFILFKSDTLTAYPKRILGVSGHIRIRYARDTDSQPILPYPCFTEFNNSN